MGHLGGKREGREGERGKPSDRGSQEGGRKEIGEPAGGGERRR